MSRYRDLYDVAREVTEETFGEGSWTDPRPSSNQTSVPSMTLEQAIIMINQRRANLDCIYDMSIATNEVWTRSNELGHVLEILSQVRS